MDVATTRGTCRAVGGGRAGSPGWRAGCWSPFPAGPRPGAVRGRGREAPAAPLPAEADGQAVPRVGVLFPPPAGAVVLVMPPVTHGGPHAPAAHGAVAAALAVAVRALHGQLHAAVLLTRQRDSATGGRGGAGRRARGPPASLLPARSGAPRLRTTGAALCWARAGGYGQRARAHAAST